MPRLALLVQEGGVERLGEVLAEVVRRSRLKRLAVAHHRLDRVRAFGTREGLASGLATDDDRHRRHRLREPPVAVDHLHGTSLRFLGRGVRGVPFLPQKLQRSYKRPRSHLPPVDVGPLVNQEREVAVGLDPLREHVVHDRLRRRAHDEGFLELLAAAARHERELGGEPFHVRRFLRDERVRDELGKVGILDARLFEVRVHPTLDRLPDGVAVRSDHHRAARGSVIRELALADDVQVPPAEILRFGRHADVLARGVLARGGVLSLRAGVLGGGGGGGVLQLLDDRLELEELLHRDVHVVLGGVALLQRILEGSDRLALRLGGRLGGVHVHLRGGRCRGGLRGGEREGRRRADAVADVRGDDGVRPRASVRSDRRRGEKSGRRRNRRDHPRGRRETRARGAWRASEGARQRQPQTHRVTTDGDDGH